MSRVSLLSAVNTLVRVLPQTIRNIDLRVAGCAAFALGVLAYFSRGCSFNPFALPESNLKVGFSSNQPSRQQVRGLVTQAIDSFLKEMDRPPGSNQASSLDFIRSSPSEDVTVEGNEVDNGLRRFYHFVFTQNDIADAIAPYLNCGLPEGVSYITAADDVKQQSWVHQILQEYRNQRKIQNFSFDNAGKVKITR